MSDLSSGRFIIGEIPAQQRDKPFTGVAITYETDGASGYAEYSRGMELATFIGNMTEERTAQLDMISVSGKLNNRVGTKLFAEVLEQVRGERFRYLRMSIISPYVVKMIERAMREDRIQGRAYRPHREWDLGDLLSPAVMEDSAVIGPSEAIEKIGNTANLECVIRL